MTKTWIEVQNVRNCTTMKILLDLQSLRRDLQFMGHGIKKSVTARVLTHFDEIPNVELFYKLSGKKCEHTQKSRSCSPGSPGSLLYFS